MADEVERRIVQLIAANYGKDRVEVFGLADGGTVWWLQRTGEHWVWKRIGANFIN